MRQRGGNVAQDQQGAGASLDTASECADNEVSVSLAVAYVCWLVGGLWGLHCFYLGRFEQAQSTLILTIIIIESHSENIFLSLFSLRIKQVVPAQGVVYLTSGGGFTLLWLRDAFMLPSYVAIANGDPTAERDFNHMRQYHTRPSLGGLRIVAQCALGAWYFHAVGAALSAVLPPHLATLGAAQALAAGIWALDNCGRRRSSLGAVMGAAAAVSLGGALLAGGAAFPWALLGALGGTISTREWKVHLHQRGILSRGAAAGAAALLLLGMAVAVASQTLASGGSSGSGGGLLLHFLRSAGSRGSGFGSGFGPDPDIRGSSWHAQGPDATGRGTTFRFEFKAGPAGFSDPPPGGGGRSNHDFRAFVRGGPSPAVREAAKLLGVGPGASRVEITAAHRTLSRQWHPDKNTGDAGRATDMQTALNRARETLLGNADEEDLRAAGW